LAASLGGGRGRVEALAAPPEHRLHLDAARPNTRRRHRAGVNRKKEEAMSRLDELTERMKTAVGADAGLGKTLKFNLKGEGFVYIDGGSVTNEDKPADLTLTISMDDLIALGEGKLDPMTAVMTGKLQLSDMGVAMGLQGKMQALFSKLK
jgi:putative sterol carrier protein